MTSPNEKLVWIERVKVQGEPYLTRVHVTPFKNWPFKTRIYIHIFSRPDEDRVFHDHPWDFRTLVLWGGYDETSHTFKPALEPIPSGYDTLDQPTGQIIHDRLGWLSWRFRPRRHAHRITRLHTPRVVTLIFRTNKTRDWGFWCPPNLPEYAGMTRSTVNNDSPYWKWVPWREYLDEPLAPGDPY